MSGRHERGSILIYGLIALFVVSAGGGLVYTYTHAITRAEKAESENGKLREVNSEFAAEVSNLKLLKAQQDMLLAKRQTSRNLAAEVERRVNAKLDTIYRQNQAAREWRDTPVPADLLAGVRGNADVRTPAKDGALPAAGVAPRPGADR